MAWVPYAMMAVGALQGKQKQDAQEEAQKADAQRAAATERYSPWTGMKSGAIRRPDGNMMGSVLGGGIGGYMAGQGLTGGSTAATAPMAEQDQSPWAQMSNRTRSGYAV